MHSANEKARASFFWQDYGLARGLDHRNTSMMDSAVLRATKNVRGQQCPLRFEDAEKSFTVKNVCTDCR